METITKEKKLDLSPKCALCGREVTESDWCYGCISYICLMCFGVGTVDELRKHEPEDHKSLWE